MSKKSFIILNFFSYLFLFTSFLLLSFIIFKIFKDNSYNYLKLYFYSVLSIFVFYFLNIFFNKIFKLYVAIISVSLIIGLYSFQAYIVFDKLSFFQDKKNILEYEKNTNKKFDTRSKLEIYNDLKKNEQITVSITPINLRKDKQIEILPLSGISNLKTILCNEGGYYSIYKSDRFGFNNPDEEWNKKKIFAVIVGDSFVHGSCVNPPNDLGGVLRSKIKAESIINLGQAGNAPLTQYASLREYLPFIKNVERVVWFHYEHNDLYSDFKEELDNKILMSYLDDLQFTQKLIKKQNDIDKILNEKLDSVLNNSIQKKKAKNKDLIVNFIKLNETRYAIFKKTKLKKKLKPHLSEFKNIMQLSKKLVEDSKAKFYFVYLPSYDYTRKNYKDPDYDNVKEIVSELKIPFIDVNHLVFKKEKNPKKLYPFESWNHFTVNGYKKVGNAVFDAINH